MKAIDYKKLRDEAIEAMIQFRKMGDDKMAEAYFNLAVHINNNRIYIDPIEIPKDATLL